MQSRLENTSWEQAKDWLEWWKRPKHLRKMWERVWAFCSHNDTKPRATISDSHGLIATVLKWVEYILLIPLLRWIPRLVTYIMLHTAMLCPLYATMDKDRFETLPESTNVVEAYNRLSKTGTLSPVHCPHLSVQGHGGNSSLLCRKWGMATTYDDRTTAA